LTVFIGPNGSGKSNIFEALLLFSTLAEQVNLLSHNQPLQVDLNFLQKHVLTQEGTVNSHPQQAANKFWRGAPSHHDVFGIVGTKSGLFDANSVSGGWSRWRISADWESESLRFFANRDSQSIAN